MVCNNKKIGDTPGVVGVKSERIQKIEKEDQRIMDKVMLVVGALIAVAVIVMYFT